MEMVLVLWWDIQGGFINSFSFKEKDDVQWIYRKKNLNVKKYVKSNNSSFF